MVLVHQNWHRVYGRPVVGLGPQDRQHHEVLPGSQELERAPDVLRRFRPAAAWRTTTAQNSQPPTPEAGSGSLVEDCSCWSKEGFDGEAWMRELEIRHSTLINLDALLAHQCNVYVEKTSCVPF